MKKQLFLLIFLCFILVLSGCSNGSSTNSNSSSINSDDSTNSNDSLINLNNNSINNEVILYKVEKDQNIMFANHSGTTHRITEYYCKDLGDSYYEVSNYKTYYFSNHLYPFNSKTSEQIVEIVKQGIYTPTYTEKLITTRTYSTSFSDGITHKDVILYVSEKIKNESVYYGINK